ncbi:MULTISPECIES: DHA2 family efflux MFS transporter permease subunit [unclassified Shinella]|uniref:DHA2 family efflux MFS transporter permease subunit n=1 Tax=unclassified Shinella TaxID=2643062 RepID=UPI00234E8D25|nr:MULTISPECIES: DHA2 family efflux MFS transporter permease subunit [unclassified Shinella]MCO5151562.1 DHA2 family efflux MFS transporter permease subunit [Shinella sp.]MDC7266428.1 DHA2 family efflux MFS transporter permease subunit [Shinella sp. HY16]MDC7273325.1 DHA2 family efflux MFS transporter permease subunit [Shinella sp. YZ44]
MTAAAVPALRKEWPGLRTLVGIGAVLLGTFTSILNARLTDIGLADIRGALGLSFDEASWITTAYVVAEVAAIPAAVWLRGILSPTRGVILGAALFSVFSLAAPLSPDLSILLSLQALRGLSAGVLIPMAYAVIMRHLPQHQRLYGLSFYALVSATTPSLSVSLEAFILEHLSWEFLFWLNIVPGALTVFAASYGLAHDPVKYMRFRKFDGFGLLALSLGLAALVAALDQGNRLDWLQSGLIVGFLLAGAFLIGAFFVHALLHPNPVVSPRLLWRRNIGLGLMMMFASRIAVMSSAFIVPQYLIRIQGYRALESSDLFLATAIPQLLLAPVVAWLCYRVDPRNLLALGGMLMGGGLLLSANITGLWASEEFLLPLLLQSVGGPLVAIPTMVLITEDITLQEIPWIASLVHIVRTVGSAIGLALVTTTVRVQEQVYSNLIGLHVESGDADVAARIETLAQTVLPRAANPQEAVGQATALLARTVQREAYVLSYADAFLLIGAIMLLATALSLALRKTLLPGRFL